MKNFDSLFDKIYQNRQGLIKYFVVIFLCSIFRSLLTPLLTAIGFVGGSAELVSWAIWSVLLYVLLKRLVFKNKLDNIYLLFTQIMIYIICVSVLWFLNSVFISIFAAFSTNSAVAMALGGICTEILCMLFMYKIVFRKK